VYDFSAAVVVVVVDKVGGMKKNGLWPYFIRLSFSLSLSFSLFPLSLPVFDISYQRFCTSSLSIRADRQTDTMDTYVI
jgi:hypothetical protein